MTTSDTVDLEALVDIEQTFYDAGYADGYAHGRIHGLIQGRALGRTQGFALWEEIGFYQGFARTWQALHAHAPGRARQDQRAMHHVTQLLELIRRFPTVNPSSSASVSSPAEHESPTCAGETETEPETEMDLSRLQRRIRSRYKALCASLGVRPTLRAGNRDEGGPDADGVSGTRDPQKRNVWTVEGDAGHPTMQGLSF